MHTSETHLKNSTSVLRSFTYLPFKEVSTISRDFFYAFALLETCDEFVQVP